MALTFAALNNGKGQTPGAHMTLSKAELSRLLFERIGLNKAEASEMVDCFFEEIRLALALGEDVKLSSFGGFESRDKRPRPGRNPKTGEEALITARRVVTFRASRILKDAIENGSPMAR